MDIEGKHKIDEIVEDDVKVETVNVEQRIDFEKPVTLFDESKDEPKDLSNDGSKRKESKKVGK